MHNRRIGTTRTQSLILASMLLALVGLATLQYRWSGELSVAYEQRVRESLANSTQSFRASFQRETAGLCRRLQVSEASTMSELQRVLSAQARSIGGGGVPYRLYALRLGDGKLWEYDASGGEFQPVAWPGSLTAVRYEIEVNAEELQHASARRRFSRPWLASGAAPVFFRAVGAQPADESIGYVLIELDAPRYFGQLNERIFRGASLESRIAVRLGAVTVFDSQSSLQAAKDAGTGIDLLSGGRIRAASEEGAWNLQAQHREGSLDAAVTTTRHRNLAASFGVCLVLLGGSVLLVVSARRAQRLAKSQADFVAAFSHELRTPIAAVCMMAENLRDGVPREPEQVSRYGALLLDQGRRLHRMIEEILAFAAQREQPLRLQPVTLADAVASVVEEEAGLLHGMTIETQIPEGVPMALADEANLKSCIANLIGNAAKYAKASGWIGIEAEAAGPGEVKLRVSDRGPGIAPEDLARVFEPFFRGRQAGTQSIAGAGLGLHLVRRRMEAVGGRVTIESAPGQGCRCTLYWRAVSS